MFAFALLWGQSRPGFFFLASFVVLASRWFLSLWGQSRPGFFYLASWLLLLGGGRAARDYWGLSYSNAKVLSNRAMLDIRGLSVEEKCTARFH